jgi:hypothetical protein
MCRRRYGLGHFWPATAHESLSRYNNFPKLPVDLPSTGFLIYLAHSIPINIAERVANGATRAVQFTPSFTALERSRENAAQTS